MSRQTRKEAAAAAQDMLKLDAARMRKPATSQSRKGAAAPMRKAQGGARAESMVPEQSSSGLAARVPEHRSSGYGAASPPPSSFTDGSCFFNGSAGGFFGSAGQSPGGQNQSEDDYSTPISARDNTYVNVDSGDETPRTEKRIFWTQEEDVRMMSSWLLNSTDSTVGADRKNEQYWTDVEATYNETTPSHRRRNAKQIKDRFHKVNKWTNLFHSAWLKARMIYTSGYNDQMWIEKAHVFYIKDNEKLNLGPFVLMEVWNTVKTEAKWITYNNGLKAARKRTATKGKEVDHIDLEKLDKFSKLQNEQNANRLKVLEIQQKLSSEKIEQAKISHLAAKEQMEAAKVQREARKLEVEARMYETYNRLLAVDTSLMSDEEKVDHGNTLKFLKKKLFTDN
ncbi:hypothetical protein DAI22_11g142100 [Oryza sativa Japonica Group]|nr:hypothetical protein DAI22_11g142100 [Oryza sativa Japonica Group]